MGMGIQRARAEDQCCACMCMETRCVYTWGSCVRVWGPGVCTHGDPACVRSCMGTRCVHAWSSCMCACVRAWGPGACTHGDPACVRGDPVCARMGILCVCVRAWGPGACTHGHPACVRACGDPVHARMGIVRAWTWSMHARDPACTVGTRCVHACVRGSGMGVTIQRAQAEDQYHI